MQTNTTPATNSQSPSIPLSARLQKYKDTASELDSVRVQLKKQVKPRYVETVDNKLGSLMRLPRVQNGYAGPAIREYQELVKKQPKRGNQERIKKEIALLEQYQLGDQKVRKTGREYLNLVNKKQAAAQELASTWSSLKDAVEKIE